MEYSRTQINMTAIMPTEDYRTLEGILTDEKLQELLMARAKLQFKVQHIFFLIQLESFKKIDRNLMPGKAMLIYQKFIKQGSFLNLDVSDDLRIPIESVLNSQEVLHNNSIDCNFFDKIEGRDS